MKRDIDSDFSKAENMYGVRDIVIEYVSKKYGYDAICGVATKDTMQAKAAIDDVTRVLTSRAYQKAGTTDKVDSKIKNYYLDLAKKMKSLIPEEVGTTFKTAVNDTQTVADMIAEHFADNNDALEILSFAKQLEGINKNYGKHAAAVIIADNGDVGAYGSLMHDDEIGWKLQMDGPDAEGIGGLLKMDFLGLKTLNIITATVRAVYENTDHQVFIDPLNIPDEPEVYREIFAKANTFGIFQFNQPGVQRILKRFQPDNFEDLVLINAINRPGPMQYIDPIIDKKHGRSVAPNAFDRVACIQDLLAPTYGYPVYQEQVMQIFQRMGQYSLGAADEIRRAMSKKKQYIIDENRELFVHGGDMENHDTHKITKIAGSESVGILAQDAYDVFDSIQDFAKYGFNKSHAAVYAQTAYITAWLKYHYPAEFFAAYLNNSDDPMEDIIRDARKNGVNVKLPDINLAANNFKAVDGAIYFGFKGLSLEAAMKDLTHDYMSLSDLVIRTNLGSKALETLAKAGALDRFSSSRNAMLKVIPTYKELKDDLKKAEQKLSDYTRLQEDLAAGKKINKDDYGMKNRKTLPSKTQIETTIADMTKKIKDLEADIKGQVIPVKQYPDRGNDKLIMEKEMLKCYVSGHPMELYGDPERYGCTAIGEAEQCECNIMGMINGLRVTTAKADPTKQMAFFTLEDQTGAIPVCAFTKAFPLTAGLLKEDAVVKLKGYIKPDSRSQDGALQFIISDKVKNPVEEIKILPREVKAIIKGIEELPELQRRLSVYQQADGHPVKVIDLTTGDISALDITVSEQAIEQKIVQ